MSPKELVGWGNLRLFNACTGPMGEVTGMQAGDWPQPAVARRDQIMTNTSIRIEQVDNRHPHWSDVLGSIFRTGNQHSLMLRDDGCLSTRQTVLAAFDGPLLVGHLCFRVEPARSSIGRTVVRSKLDSFAVDHECDGQTVEELLFQTAEQRAQMMQCAPPRHELAAC